MAEILTVQQRQLTAIREKHLVIRGQEKATYPMGAGYPHFRTVHSETRHRWDTENMEIDTLRVSPGGWSIIRQVNGSQPIVATPVSGQGFLLAFNEEGEAQVVKVDPTNKPQDAEREIILNPGTRYCWVVGPKEDPLEVVERIEEIAAARLPTPIKYGDQENVPPRMVAAMRELSKGYCHSIPTRQLSDLPPTARS